MPNNKLSPTSDKSNVMPSVEQVEFIVEELERIIRKNRRYILPYETSNEDWADILLLESLNTSSKDNDNCEDEPDKENTEDGVSIALKLRLSNSGDKAVERNSVSSDSGVEYFFSTREYKPGALNELMALTGLEQIKKAVNRQLAFFRTMRLRKETGHNVPSSLKHILLAGNPGTGKTTVARLIARIYYEEGITRRPELVECNRASLVGRYIGETEEKTLDAINKAKGGMLFIDEIYALTEDASDRRDFGFKAIDTMMPVLSDLESDVIIIGAGYEEEMDHFLASNPGLASRFPMILHFKDFSLDQLFEIAVKRLQDYDFRLSDDASMSLKELLLKLMKIKNFGNARMAMTLVDNFIIPNLCVRQNPVGQSYVNISSPVLEISDIIDVRDIPSYEDVVPLINKKERKSLGYRLC